MVTKKILIEFADKRIRAVDHLYDIQKAVDNAKLNLFSRYDIRIQNTHITDDDRFIVDIDIPEELSHDFNAGRRLRGISKYLLDEQLFSDKYHNYKVGNRLLDYEEINDHTSETHIFSKKDSLKAIKSFIELLENGGQEQVQYINRIINTINEANQHFSFGRVYNNIMVEKGITRMTQLDTNDYLNIFSDMFFNIDTADESIKNTLLQTREIFSTLVYKLGEVSNELNNTIEISKEDRHLHLVISLFVRKLMEQVDAINILYTYGSVTEAELILRSMFETVVSLKFILLKDDEDREESRFRAAAYFMGHHYQELVISDKHMQPGGLMDKIPTEVQQKLDKKKTAINNIILKNAVFKRVDDERNRLKNPKNFKWYKVTGVQNVKEMMAAVGLDKYYEGLYSPLSMETHALNVAMAMKIKDGAIIPDRIRSPHNAANTFSLTCTFIIDALIVLYKYLGDGASEKLDFAEFYKEFIEKRNIVEKNLSKII